MDSKPETPPPNDGVSKPAPGSGPVMDVVPPPAATSTTPPPPAPPADNKPHDAPPAETDSGNSPADVKPAVQPTPSKPVTPRTPRSGVGLAIFGTIVIVLGLAALAVYAYIKTK